MVGGIIAVIIQGTLEGNDGATVWENARVSGRLDFLE